MTGDRYLTLPPTPRAPLGVKTTTAFYTRGAACVRDLAGLNSHYIPRKQVLVEEECQAEDNKG